MQVTTLALGACLKRFECLLSVHGHPGLLKFYSLRLVVEKLILNDLALRLAVGACVSIFLLTRNS